MNQIEQELKLLVDALLSMTKMSIKQMKKAKEAYLKMDIDMAEEVIHNENRLNSMELSIDRDCENFLALFNPVASNLRLVIAVLKIISELERIGDYACGIAQYVVEYPEPIGDKLAEDSKVERMFDLGISMLKDIMVAIEEEDTELARKVYHKDSKLNKMHDHAMHVIRQAIEADPGSTQRAMYLFSVIKKLERAGDHIKNIAEDLIFYVEAVVLRHKDRGEVD